MSVDTAATGQGLAQELDRVQELADHVVPITVRALCRFGIFDLLKEGPETVSELASRSGTNADALYRMMRALAAKGLFTEVSDHEFALSGLGRLLRTDGTLSLGDAYPLLEAELVAWAHVEHTLTTGSPAFDRVYGQPYYEYVAQHPEHAARFDRAVERQNRLVARTLRHAYDWESCATIVDVGSGNGAFLAALLTRHRGVRGVAFDLPHVVAGAAEVVAAAGLADRMELVGGSFFEEIPRGGDTYVLKTILHDWDDEDGVRILNGIREALPADGRLLVIEALLTTGDEFHIGKILDLYSLVLRGGRERTEEEVRRLLARAGLNVSRRIPTSPLGMLEVTRAER